MSKAKTIPDINDRLKAARDSRLYAVAIEACTRCGAGRNQACKASEGRLLDPRFSVHRERLLAALR